MKLQILSDIHNEFSVLPIPQTDADVVILAGDIDIKNRAIEWAEQFEKPVLYVLGNHEFYGELFQKIQESTRKLTEDTNIRFLDDKELVIDGVRFLGGTLWTDFKLFGPYNAEHAKLDAQFSMNDYKTIRFGPNYRRLLPSDTLQMHEKTVSFLKERLAEPFEGKTVIITHHAPSPQSVAPQYKNDKLSPSFASDLEHLMGEPVVLWVHGHVHNCNDYEVKGTRVVSNPRGYQSRNDRYPENGAFKPGLVVEV
jgi:Icc-related predicted phosphoesterase